MVTYVAGNYLNKDKLLANSKGKFLVLFLQFAKLIGFLEFLETHLLYDKDYLTWPQSKDNFL